MKTNLKIDKIVKKATRKVLKESIYDQSFEPSFEPGYYICQETDYDNGDVDCWIGDEKDARECEYSSEGSSDGPYETYEDAYNSAIKQGMNIDSLNENCLSDKNRVKTLNESQLNNLVTKIVKESVKKVLNKSKKSCSKIFEEYNRQQYMKVGQTLYNYVLYIFKYLESEPKKSLAYCQQAIKYAQQNNEENISRNLQNVKSRIGGNYAMTDIAKNALIDIYRNLRERLGKSVAQPPQQSRVFTQQDYYNINNGRYSEVNPEAAHTGWYQGKITQNEYYKVCEAHGVEPKY